MLLACRNASPFLDPLQVSFPPRLFDFFIVLIAHADNSLKTIKNPSKNEFPL